MDPAKEGKSIRARIGVCPQSDNLDPDLSVHENLRVYASYFAIESQARWRKADELLDFVQLGEKKNRSIAELSGGMKRRLVIARALLNDPELLLLDEPTTGLDPQARHLIWQKLRELKARGVTMVLTTHYMDEAERLCDRIVIMDQGKILAQGSPRQLIDEHVGQEVFELRGSDAAAETILVGLGPEAFGGSRLATCSPCFSLSKRRFGETARGARSRGGCDVPSSERHARRRVLELTGRELDE